MSYIDDWGITPQTEKSHLLEICKAPSCGHVRYQHGDAAEGRNHEDKKIVFYEPGPCRTCGCEIFWKETPITKDDVLDLAVALRYDIRLEDIGIAPVTEDPCLQLTIRHTGAGQMTAQCTLLRNHTGDHAPDWNNLKG